MPRLYPLPTGAATHAPAALGCHCRKVGWFRTVGDQVTLLAKRELEASLEERFASAGVDLPKAPPRPPERPAATKAPAAPPPPSKKAAAPSKGAASVKPGPPVPEVLIPREPATTSYAPLDLHAVTSQLAGALPPRLTPGSRGLRPSTVNDTTPPAKSALIVHVRR